MLRTKHLKMAVVPMTLLALLSTAVPVASAQETTDESFYELTTTPSGGDMIVGEPGTTILFDSSNGELVDVLPPSEAEDYSVTVSRGCADSNAGCWAGGNALGDMQFAGTGTATGPGRIATAIRPAISRDRSPSQSMELHTPLSQLVRGCASPRQTALASTAYPLPAGKDVFLNFGPVSSDAGPLRSRRSHRPSPWPPVPQPMPMLSGSAGSERSHVSSMSGSACFSACLRSFSASRSSSRVLNLSVSAFSS